MAYNIMTLNENPKKMILLSSCPGCGVLYIMFDNGRKKHKNCHSSNVFYIANLFSSLINSILILTSTHNIITLKQLFD
jgi:hypothetical protein